MKIDGSLVLITGASQGIGAATAIEMAREGARVVLLARTAEKLNAVAKEVQAVGGQAHVYPCDLTDGKAVRQVAERIKAEVGIPDIIMNNAGAGLWRALEETEPEEAVELMSVPYFAAYYVTREFIDEMVQRGSGRIANVNSPMCYFTIRGATGYTATRRALRGFNDSLRADLLGTGVGVTHLVFGEVTSEYFHNNPGSHERIPAVNNIIPTLSPEQTARLTVKALRAEKNEIVRPRIIWFMVLLLRLFPGITNWVTTIGGWKRPAQLTETAQSS